MFELKEDQLFTTEKFSEDKYRFNECNNITYLVEIHKHTYKSFSYIEPLFYPKEFSSYSDRKKFGYLYDHNRDLDHRCPLKIISTVIKLTN